MPEYSNEDTREQYANWKFPIEQPKHEGGVKGVPDSAQRMNAETAKEVSGSIPEKLKHDVEQSPLLDFSSFQNRGDALVKQYQQKFNLQENASGEEVMIAYDHAYLQDLKDRMTVVGEGVIDAYEASSSDQPMTYHARQEFLNALVNPANRIYKNERGEDASLGDYLKEYYGKHGIEVAIQFGTLPAEVKESIISDVQFFDEGGHLVPNDVAFSYIRNDEIAIPFVIVRKGDRIIRSPLLAGDRDIAFPVEPERLNGKTDQSQAQLPSQVTELKIVHDPRYASTVQCNLGFIIHEIDHTVRTVLPNYDQTREALDRQDRIISEGTAELARHQFSETQNTQRPMSGFDYQNHLSFAVSGVQEGVLTERHGPRVRQTYASGLVLVEQMRKSFGDQILWSVAYEGQETIPDSDLAELRHSISTKLQSEKDIFENFMLR